MTGNSKKEQSLKVDEQFVINATEITKLFDLLKKKKYKLHGPTVREDAIVYDCIDKVEDLPIGFIEEQDGGRYRLKKTKNNSLFSYVVGLQSWKKYLHLPRVKLWEAVPTKKGFEINSEFPKAEKKAFIGVRSCELHAIAIQDKIFLEGEYPDPIYKSQRENIFIVAVNCTRSGDTCFCTSMNTGPKAEKGFDLALTEIIKKDKHQFVVESGSAKGLEIVKQLASTKAKNEIIQEAEKLISNTANNMGRKIETNDLKKLLKNNPNHPHWNKVGKRCLNCANCTMVCPTCFCTTIDDVTELTGASAERIRRWDSCYTQDFSYIHGGSVRPSASARYRQWITHKLSSWIDQFGTFGCVGCGRCITWCPVGIDLTEEVKAIRASAKQPASVITGEETHEN